MPFLEAALEECLTGLERETAELPDYEEGYRLWREAFEKSEAGVFSIPVNQAIDFVQATFD
jgi:hypothetical protein